MEKKALVLWILIAFIAGFGLSQVLAQVKYDKLNQAYEKVKKFLPVAPEEVRSISGVIKEIKDNAIILTVNESPFGVAFVNYKEAVARLTKDTEIFSIDMTQAPKMDEKGIPILPKKILALSDLKVGTTIAVEASENIKNKKDFEAKSVSVAVPPPAAPAQ